MTEIREHRLQLGERFFHVAEQGDGPLVLLLHGWPESWYSWRHQMRALAEAGYRAVAPNQRGYAGSHCPAAVEAYDIVELAQDAADLIGALGHDRAVVIGHDWGAPVAYHTAMLHPGRVRAVAGLSVPYGGRPRVSPLATFRKVFKDMFFYMLYFQEPGVAEAELEADLRRTLSLVYGSSSGDAPEGAVIASPVGTPFLDTMKPRESLPPWLSEQELAVYTEQFQRSGFRGPINWYRNFDRSWQRTEALAQATIDQPALFVGGQRDPVIILSGLALGRMPRRVPNLTGPILLEGVGHWIQQEAPDQVNRTILEFLEGIPKE